MWETWILTLITFLIGYALGKGSINKENIEVIRKTVVNAFKPVALGGVRRPTQQDIEKRRDPKRQEEEEIMSETFAKLQEDDV